MSGQAESNVRPWEFSPSDGPVIDQLQILAKQESVQLLVSRLEVFTKPSHVFVCAVYIGYLGDPIVSEYLEDVYSRMLSDSSFNRASDAFVGLTCTLVNIGRNLSAMHALREILEVGSESQIAFVMEVCSLCRNLRKFREPAELYVYVQSQLNPSGS